MKSHEPFSAFLIGGDTLLAECGDILLREGHDIRGVITAEPRIAEWARAVGLPVVDAKDDYRPALTAEPFDFLFAITHLAIIPEDVLALPRRLAINFHDGPLPRYAGLNAPVWALIDQEQSYGISWHVMTSGVDRGAILHQVPIDISPRETALSLNTKCLVAATESFPRLVSQLAGGSEQPVEQDESDRSYFARHDRPPAACAIDWSRPASEIDALVRGLTFGPYPNPVGSPKTYKTGAPRKPVVVTAVEPLEGRTGRDGEIIALSHEGVEVAAGRDAIAIRRAMTPDGAELSPNELVEWLDLATGDLLGSDDDVRATLTELDAELGRHEDFWVERLATLQPPSLPNVDAEGGPPDVPPARRSVEIPPGLHDSFEATTSAILGSFAVYLAKTGRSPTFDLAFRGAGSHAAPGWYGSTVPLRIELDSSWSVQELVGAVRSEMEVAGSRGPYLRDLALRRPGLADAPSLRGSDPDLPVGVRIGGEPEDGLENEVLCLAISNDGGRADLVYDASRFEEREAGRIVDALQACLKRMAADPDASWQALQLATDEERHRQLVEWNDTSVEWDRSATIHGLFEAQVARTPEAVAVRFEERSLSYRDLDRRADALASHLRDRGVETGDLVGVAVDRSVDLLVATLGVLKAGAAYLPLDPEFPPDRIEFMIEDSGTRLLVAQDRIAERLPGSAASVVRIDGDWDEIIQCGSERPDGAATGEDLAYAIYTSGSTGRPKGVLVEHRNVVNFFTGMDAVIEHDPPGVWLAVTSLSFDISVLELFWTMARGFEVVVYKDAERDHEGSRQPAAATATVDRGMEFGLFMWGNDDRPTPDKYELMLDGARFFDQNGFDSVWTPERHFHAFGGPFPNPSVTGAALAAVTSNVAIRAGSCVSPLHHPIRIAEEWSVVDNLSGGRVGLSFAAGWQPNDFVLRPESYPDQKKVMFEQIDTVRRLWRGEELEFENPLGKTVPVTTLPRPVQKELPFWVTTAGNPESYRLAGSIGANVLTHLLGQTFDEVAEKIAIYREARREAGLDPREGKVTLMLHTFVGNSDGEVREIVRQPMKDYLGASMKLVLGFAWTFPAFKRPGGPDAEPEDVDLEALSDEETDAILDFAFERYFETSGLFGTVDRCLEVVDRCKQIDADEIACLLDFGVEPERVMQSLPLLKRVRDESNRSGEEPASGPSFAGQVRRHGVTHLQCTPSMARMFLTHPTNRAAFAEIDHVMIGGEAFPPALARELMDLSVGTVTNMYGPTETTIWSSTHRLEDADGGDVPIGRPIANTDMYVLDPHSQLLPTGVPGELFIGGEGVTRGYHRRPDLTNARFVPNPFRPGERMYATGDLVRYSDDGLLEFVGRIDHQVKIRGHRIELGEIESVLNQHEGIEVGAVVVHEPQPEDVRLVAYFVPEGEPPGEADLKDHLRAFLPEYMVPGRLIEMDRMPLTPNGKIDRKALPAFEDTAAVPDTEYVEPEGTLERTIARCWCSTLGIERVGVNDNFFDIGGHSLLVVQLHRKLTEEVEHPLSLVDLYRFPTIRSLTEHLGENGSSADLEETVDRAEKRRAAMARRRRG